MNFKNYKLSREQSIAVQVIAAILALVLLSGVLSIPGAHAELIADDELDEVILEEEDWIDLDVILDDPALFMSEAELEEIEYIDLTDTEDDIDVSIETPTVEDNNNIPAVIEEVILDADGNATQVSTTYASGIPVITSVGKEVIKVKGVKSKYTLIQYTIPEKLLAADPTFLALMVEAEKYIGYPYVYGASNPDTGFDCSGFVCWVYMKSGVYNTGRRGANGLHSLCTEIDEYDLRPGDLVFFKGTMGKDVKGITHVGIYVGNGMMIHAGDPVGFADLRSEKWRKKINCYGRLPID